VRRGRGAAVERHLDQGMLRVRLDNVSAVVPLSGAQATRDVLVTIRAADFTPDEAAEEPGGSTMVNEGGA
jgi:hypothetical protein